MNISRTASCLSVIVFNVIVFSLNTSSQNLYSGEESEEFANICTVHATELKQSAMETDQEDSFNSKGIVRVPLLLYLHRSNYAFEISLQTQSFSRTVNFKNKKDGGKFPPITQPLLF